MKVDSALQLHWQSNPVKTETWIDSSNNLISPPAIPSKIALKCD